MTTDKIYLIGFMAAGKSTVGKALANRLHWEFRDLDELIEEREQLSVADFFLKKGEAAFRKAESAMLVRAVRAGLLVRTTPIQLTVVNGLTTSHFRPIADSLRIANAVIRARLSRGAL